MSTPEGGSDGLASAFDKCLATHDPEALNTGRTMTQDEKALLENVLDSLDRLFDHNSMVIDVYALLFATSKALVDSTFHPHIEPLVGRLLVIMRSQRDEESRRDAALVVTDGLRKVLAGSLPKPGK